MSRRRIPTMFFTPAARRLVCAPASQTVFPDEILEDIFIRLDAMEDLVRTSVACTTFRRIVCRRRFLRRFRSLHPPPVLGLLEFGARGRRTFQFQPAKPPHRVAPAARALARSADFTFTFLDCTHLWHICDASEGRVLLYRRDTIFTIPDLMVCDPLYRRQVELPAIPDDVVAATGCEWWPCDPFFDRDTDKDKEEQDLSFRVMSVVHCEDKLVIFRFSSVTGQWRAITFNRTVPLYSFLVEFQESFQRHFAHGCYFWRMDDETFIMLNMRDMELSVLDLPRVIYDESRELAIVEAGEDILGLFTLRGDMLHLYHKSLRGTEWQHQRIIHLPKPNIHWSVYDVAAGHLLLKASQLVSSKLEREPQYYFTLSLKTFQVDELCVLNYDARVALYASFLFPFSQASI